MACSHPSINPASTWLPTSFHTTSPSRASDSLRPLLSGLRGSYIPLPWNQEWKKTITRTHLPLNALCHLLLPVVSQVPTFPIAQPHLLPASETTPGSPRLRHFYSAVKFRARAHLRSDWQASEPPPLYYCYPLTTIPHPFIGLDQFTSGRIHQIRADKGNLAAQPNCGDSAPDTSCPRCGLEDETLEHVRLNYHVLAAFRRHYFPNIDSVGPASPLWSSKDHLLNLTRYINTTDIAFQPLMHPRWATSPSPDSPDARVLEPALECLLPLL